MKTTKMKVAFRKLMVAVFCLTGMLSAAQARIELPGLFTDNMVLQQQTDAPLWGKAEPGKTVTVSCSWQTQPYQTKAGDDGRWLVRVKTPAAGGPYRITISDGKKVALNNVLIGEVWICSGQSNMEMPLSGWGKVDQYEKEIAEADYPQIRLFQVAKKTSAQPLNDVVSAEGWQACSPATVPEFSSTAYFFGRCLHQALHVPIGLIHTSWGGTVAEAWTSGESLETMPAFRETVREMRRVPEEELQAIYEKQYKEWSRKIAEADEGLTRHWENAALNDSDWKQMAAPGLWEDRGLNDFDGIVWFRKELEIPASWSGKALSLHLGMVDDNDVTYFNGQEIGRTEGYNLKRTYTIPARLVKAGKATLAVRATDTGGGGGLYGEPQEMYLTLQSGNEESRLPLSGDWKYKVAVDLKRHEKAPPSQAGNPNRPSVLFNAMIHPLLPYALQGVVWYQGESNEDRPRQYRELFPLLIRDWRLQWKRDFPFYFVQLANYKNTSRNWAELREAQLTTLSLENTGMAVAIDIGDPVDIHPKNKQEVGRRLALAARANTYGQGIAYSGPIYDSYRMEGERFRIFFRHNQGLKSRDKAALNGFEIAGSDHRFHPATAVVEDDAVVVGSPEVRFPVAVRYAWANDPEGNLCNEAGLPASPFRTDDFDE